MRRRLQHQVHGIHSQGQHGTGRRDAVRQSFHRSGQHALIVGRTGHLQSDCGPAARRHHQTLGRQFTHEQSRTFGHLLARVVLAEHDDIATLNRVIDRREGKVYLDYLQNGHGKLIAAPFSARPRPGAPVSMPLRWDEVRPGLAILDFTLANAVDRMRELDDDPMAPILDTTPDLLTALERLQARLA